MKTTSLNAFCVGILASFIVLLPAGLYAASLSFAAQGSLTVSMIYEGLFFIFGTWWIFAKEAKPIQSKLAFTHFVYYLIGFMSVLLIAYLYSQLGFIKL